MFVLFYAMIYISIFQINDSHRLSSWEGCFGCILAFLFEVLLLLL